MPLLITQINTDESFQLPIILKNLGFNDDHFKKVLNIQGNTAAISQEQYTNLSGFCQKLQDKAFHNLVGYYISALQSTLAISSLSSNSTDETAFMDLIRFSMIYPVEQFEKKLPSLMREKLESILDQSYFNEDLDEAVSHSMENNSVKYREVTKANPQQSIRNLIEFICHYENDKNSVIDLLCTIHHVGTRHELEKALYEDYKRNNFTSEGLLKLFTDIKQELSLKLDLRALSFLLNPHGIDFILDKKSSGFSYEFEQQIRNATKNFDKFLQKNMKSDIAHVGREMLIGSLSILAYGIGGLIAVPLSLVLPGARRVLADSVWLANSAFEKHELFTKTRTELEKLISDKTPMEHLNAPRLDQIIASFFADILAKQKEIPGVSPDIYSMLCDPKKLNAILQGTYQTQATQQQQESSVSNSSSIIFNQTSPSTISDSSKFNNQQ